MDNSISPIGRGLLQKKVRSSLAETIDAIQVSSIVCIRSII